MTFQNEYLIIGGFTKEDIIISVYIKVFGWIICDCNKIVRWRMPWLTIITIISDYYLSNNIIFNYGMVYKT